MQEEVRITDLIPQRAPIVMVDEFLSYDGERSTTALTVREDNIFVDGGRMSECGLIEHVAQSAAARVGWECREKGVGVPLGFIGSVNRFTAERLPLVGERIVTTVEVVQQVFAITLIQAECRIGDETVAQGRMKIFIKED